MYILFTREGAPSFAFLFILFFSPSFSMTRMTFAALFLFCFFVLFFFTSSKSWPKSDNSSFSFSCHRGYNWFYMVVSGQWFVASGPCPADSGQWLVVHGQWSPQNDPQYLLSSDPRMKDSYSYVRPCQGLKSYGTVGFTKSGKLWPFIRRLPKRR